MIASVRFPLFRTGFLEWPLGSNVGTVFLVRYKGRPYAVFPKHIANSFSISDITISSSLSSRKSIGLDHVRMVSGIAPFFTGSDVEDLCVGVFPRLAKASDFEEIYQLSGDYRCRSQQGDYLTVFGFIKESSSLATDTIIMAHHSFDVTDTGSSQTDPTLRCASAAFNSDSIASISGISGAPVFNHRTKEVCGIVLRGGLTENNNVIINYLDIIHVYNTVVAAHLGADRVHFVLTEKGTISPIFTRKKLVSRKEYQSDLSRTPRRYLLT